MLDPRETTLKLLHLLTPEVQELKSLESARKPGGGSPSRLPRPRNGTKTATGCQKRLSEASEAGTMETPEEVFAALKSGSVSWGTVFTPKMLTMSWTEAGGWEAPVIKPYGPLSLMPSSSIFHYGMEIFEGLKAFSTHGEVHIFRPDKNIARMNASAARLALPQIPNARFLHMLKSFVNSVREWVPPSEVGSLYLRPVLIATEPRIGVKRSCEALFFVIGCPVGGFFQGGDEGAVQGVSLRADTRFVRAWKGGVGDCKTGGNYAVSIAPAEQARVKGFDQVLWLSDERERRVTEAGMMNVFFVEEAASGRVLVTPRLDGTILEGVTRDSVLAIAREAGVECVERDIGVEEVCEKVRDGRFVEAFGTGTAALVCPIWKIDCCGEVVETRMVEREQDLSVLFRKKLKEIQKDGTHEWMVKVDDKDVLDG